MKKILSAAVVCACMLSCNNDAKKDDTTKTTADTTSSTKSMDTTMTAAAKPPLDSATMMKNWQAYMTPGPVHKMMASWDGKWNGDITMWMTPGAPPMTSKGTTENRMVLGGRYQVSKTTSTMMGMPLEGMGTLAYDNDRKVFINTWLDNMGTGLMKTEGSWDEASKTITLKGKMVDGSRGDGSEMDVRETFQVIDDKNQVMEMFCPGPDGKEYKTMQIKYTKS